MKSKLAEKNMGMAIKLIHTGLLMYAQAYNDYAAELYDDPDYKLGNDQFCGPAWKAIAKELHDLMAGPNNLETGNQRAELSHQLHLAANKAGISLDQ